MGLHTQLPLSKPFSSRTREAVAKVARDRWQTGGTAVGLGALSVLKQLGQLFGIFLGCLCPRFWASFLLM